MVAMCSMVQIYLPQQLINAFWGAQTAYIQLEAQGLDRRLSVSEYQEISRVVGDLFARSYDGLMIAATSANPGRTVRESIRAAIGKLEQIVEECRGSRVTPQDYLAEGELQIPQLVVDSARWSSEMVRICKGTGDIPTRVLMEARDSFFHLVVAAEQDDTANKSVHIACACEHIIMAGQEAVEYTIRQHLSVVADAFKWRKKIRRLIVGSKLPEIRWQSDIRQAVIGLGDARKLKGRPETKGNFEDSALDALDISVALANAVYQGKIRIWRHVVNGFVVLLGIVGAAVSITAFLL